MSFTKKQRDDFNSSVAAIRATEKGKEATMYTSLRDIFVDALGYPKTSVVVDTSGVRGRPDLTVSAPGGAAGSKVSWIVLEAKDEHNAVLNTDNRAKLFAEKAKYITADTAFFVMVDPDVIVVRGVWRGDQYDKQLLLDGLTIDKFYAELSHLRAEIAGVPEMLREFRSGNEELIAQDKLLAPPEASQLEAISVQINKNVFFDTLSETTQLLQKATLGALQAVKPQRLEIAKRVGDFAAQYGGYIFRPYPISIDGKSRPSREDEKAHRKESALLRRFLVQRPALSRLTLDALPRFAERSGLSLVDDLDKVERFFATETANLILARVLLIRFLEDHGFFNEIGPDGVLKKRYLCNGGVAAFSNESSDLRKLFLSGSRWAIREIVDLELIWEQVFDADVLPMLLIAEATPAKQSDVVRIRLADETCVKFEPGAKRPTFEFDHLPEEEIEYGDVFTPDARIMTRLTPRRADIIKRLRQNGRLKDAALKYWTRRGQPAQAMAPAGIGGAKWSEEHLIKDGLAKRGQTDQVPSGGHTLYKGENITAMRFSGTPIIERYDVTKASTPSIWAYQDILPSVMYAIPVIEQVPVAAPFDPKSIAIENTAVVFGPRTDLADVPFDAILLSTIYAYFHMIAGRRSYQNKLRGHVYSSAVSDLPWNDALSSSTTELLGIRAILLDASEKQHNQSKALASEAASLGLQPLKLVVRAAKGAKIDKSEAFDEAPEAEMLVGAIIQHEGSWRLPLDDDNHFIAFNQSGVAELARAGLALRDGEHLSWQAILESPIPTSASMAFELAKLLEAYSPEELDRVVEAQIEKLDKIVGHGLGLTKHDIDEIRHDMGADPFLSRVRHRMPYMQPRQLGRRLKLERSDRYS